MDAQPALLAELTLGRLGRRRQQHLDASGAMLATADRCGLLCVWEVARDSLRLVSHVPPVGGGATELRGLVITESGGANVAGRALVYSTRNGRLTRVSPKEK